MSLTYVPAWAAAVHLLICAVFFLLMRRGILKVPSYVLPFLVFVPFWGCLCVVVLHLHLKTHEGSAMQIPLEKFRIEDEVFKSLSLETVRESNVAPLEEVLMLAPSDVRRRMMLDILNDAPDRYTDVLLQARGGDDTEVVHYATTAMAEMSKQHDLQLQHFENAYNAEPENVQILEAYIGFLEEYLSHGFAQGRAEKIERNQLAKLLERLWNREKSMDAGLRLSRQLMILGESSKAREVLDEMIALWPAREEPRLLKIECLALMGEGEALRENISRAREEGVYFSAQGDEKIAFWLGGVTS